MHSCICVYKEVFQFEDPGLLSLQVKSVGNLLKNTFVAFMLYPDCVRLTTRRGALCWLYSYQFSLFTLCELFSRLIDDHHNPAVHSPAYVISVLPFLFFLLLSFASLLTLSWLQHPTSCFLIVVSLTHLHLLNTMMITIKKPHSVVTSMLSTTLLCYTFLVSSLVVCPPAN